MRSVVGWELCCGDVMELEKERFTLAYRVEQRSVLDHDVSLVLLLLFLLLWGLFERHIDKGPAAPWNAHDGYKLN